jgi:hypothetical protein
MILPDLFAIYQRNSRTFHLICTIKDKNGNIKRMNSCILPDFNKWDTFTDELKSTLFNEAWCEGDEWFVEPTLKIGEESTIHTVNIDDKDWIKYSYMYNKMNAFDRIKSIESFEQADVLVKFNLNHITTDMYQEFITNIQSIIDNTDEGDYEYHSFTLSINNKIDRAADKIIVDNPRIKKEHLYKIF